MKMEKSGLENTKLGLFLAGVLLIALFSVTASGDDQKNLSIIMDYEPPKLFTPKNIYIVSKEPVQVEFKVNAIDNTNGKVHVQCDKISGSIFKLGKTTVRCETEDSTGNKSRSSFVVTVGYNIVQIPSWVKQPTKFWIENSIDDKTYAKTMSFLIKEQLVDIPFAKNPNNSESEIPVWIKINAKAWIDNKINDDEYSIILQWLINRNIIQF
ncbi:MAG: HYR domain-containing protein [Nitrosopumilus sp.]|nr:HYR domain-containing protein [Nitrosopumilus sp.]